MYCSNLHVTPAIWGNYVQHVEELMKESWDAETSIKNRAVMDPLIINLKETSKEEVIQKTGQSHLNKWGKY